MAIVWRDEARSDISEIYGYISQDDPVAAVRVADAIYEYANRELTSFKERGRPGRVAGTRELVVSDFPSYIVVYEIIDHDVEIIAVMHGAQEWPKDFQVSR